MIMRRMLIAALAGSLMVAAGNAAVAREAKGKPATTPAAASGGAEPTLIGQFGSWGAYTASPGGKKVCFALAKPSSSKTTPEPAARSGLCVHLDPAV